MTDIKVGVVVLGNLGGPIASRLSEKFKLLGFDPAKDTKSAPEGVMLVSSLNEIALQADLDCLSLPTTEAVLAVITALSAVPVEQRRVKVILELSTVGVKTAERSQQLPRQAGIRYVDAPVSSVFVMGDKAGLGQEIHVFCTHETLGVG